ncbi:beta-1,3-galactosyltransferase 2-like [Trichomycterus rosablanca]|uniref:beta-1,3-galactosyltransferase 2-like n=1 Tax=Trichomycterus rosablanca TaxID=2290929 RepID=UPI002F3577B5
MVEDASKSGDKSTDLEKKFERWRCRPRNCLLVLIVLTVVLLYYVNISQVSEIWLMIYNTTSTETASNATAINLLTLQSTVATTLAGKKNDSISILPTEEPCTPETPYHVAYPCRYHYIINEPESCQQDNPFLVLMVPVAPNNRRVRDAIRSTWGTEKVVMQKVIRLFFVLGQPGREGQEEEQQKLIQESEEFHDIVQSNFMDSYNNLTIKTMIILEWLTSYCRNASYAMKIDSDIFLNLDVLVNMLLKAPIEKYMTGLVAKGAMVRREPRSKWYLPKTVYFEDFYPPYALGLAYVMSLDLPEKLVEGAKQVKAVYIEDIYLGLCMRHLGIPFTSQRDQSLFNVFPVPYNRCRYSKLIATTTNSLEEQVNSWKDYKRPEPHC